MAASATRQPHQVTCVICQLYLYKHHFIHLAYFAPSAYLAAGIFLVTGCVSLATTCCILYVHSCDLKVFTQAGPTDK